ncbi:Uncharacterised protein [Moraxella cuniculi]|uniref:Uncharacterized protein n=1 Tax=Moraxella cuniculi TaxID=34061 RepID=A0A3S4QPX4_9GAMM|nr:Uncharacterised protein [Moraxella cuniculi]
MSNLSLRLLSWIFFIFNCLYIPLFLVQLGGFLSSSYMACVRVLKYGRFYDSLMSYTIIFGLFIILNLCFLCVIYLLNRNMIGLIIKENKRILVFLTALSHVILLYSLWMDIESDCSAFPELAGWVEHL